jgi:hypothetical protein
MANLEKEVWINQLMEGFYPDSSFLKYAKDFSNLTENDAINLAAAGIDPVVMINNTTYPIQIVQRIDTPIRIELDKFETKNTLVRRPEVIEYAYDQLESVLMGHRNTLRARTAEKAAHAYAPAQDTPSTPVIPTTGETRNGRKQLSFEDIFNLKERFDNAGIPFEKRYLVLHPSHLSDLLRLDIRIFKDITDIVDGQPKRFAGFSMLQFSKPATYNGSTMEKKAFGAIPGDNDTFCSFGFYGDEVMKADGEVYMYRRDDDPEQRGTIVGFDKRFIALPIRNIGIGAIVSSLDPNTGGA